MFIQHHSAKAERMNDFWRFKIWTLCLSRCIASLNASSSLPFTAISREYLSVGNVSERSTLWRGVVFLL
jgi:hypothetical protein